IPVPPSDGFPLVMARERRAINYTRVVVSIWKTCGCWRNASSDVRAQLFGRRAIDRAVAREGDAVVPLRLFARDEPVGDVGGNRIGIALARRAMAGAARQLEPQEVAGRNGLPSLRPDRPARAAPHLSGAASRPGAAPARWIFHPREIARRAPGRAAGAADLDPLAEAAAELAGATRALAKLAAAEQHRRDRFRRLDRDGAHAARE